MNRTSEARERKKGKTIFFLGAGFSMGAGAPSQAELMSHIHNFNVVEYVDQYGYMYPDSFKKKLNDQHKAAVSFISDLLAKSPDIDLEDIYTPIDRCIISNHSFKGHSTHKLNEIRNAINALVGLIIDKSFKDQHASYVDNFADHIVKTNYRTKKGDHAVVFSTNWDIILDHAIYEKRRYSGTVEDVIDYCCHYTNYNHGDSFIPPLVAKERGAHTHKILKLHGSLNWLKCMGCGRIQVSFNEKVALRHFYDHTQCRFCGTTEMVPEMLMPTFLKQNENMQLKHVWDQACKELLEVERIVFMGYSLPMADFEIRQLLSRFLDQTVEIEVVLTKSSDPKEYSMLKDNIKNKIVYHLPSSRYKRFFAKNNPTFFYEGVEKYISNLGA